MFLAASNARFTNPTVETDKVIIRNMTMAYFTTLDVLITAFVCFIWCMTGNCSGRFHHMGMRRDLLGMIFS